MNAEITFSQLYWNCSLMGFFFREQSKLAVEDLMARVEDPQTAIEKIDEFASDCELDDIEEMFYNDDVEDLAETFGLELRQDGDEDEDEE